uniref:Protein E8^E2C n=1 Tax=Eidolon bat papillomavirus TaxID=3141875 RepID=A0AAU7E2J7_9PAPI
MADRGMDPQEGTSGLQFIDAEAEVDNGTESGDEADDGSDQSSISDLFDETDQAPGNPLLLFQQQQAEEDARLVALIKRKHLTTPEHKAVQALSPRLTAMRISPPRVLAKKQLFRPEDDSGVGLSLLEDSHETADTSASVSQVEDGARGAADGQEETISTGGSTENGRSGSSGEGGGELPSAQVQLTPPTPQDGGGTGEGSVLAAAILRSHNRRVCMLAEFKAEYGVSYTDLVRTFKSDKTCCKNWVLAIFGLCEPIYHTLRTVIPEQCDYSHMELRMTRKGGIAIMLCEFKAVKNRATVQKMLKTIANIPEELTLIQPPQIRSPPAALYWVQRAPSSCTDVVGSMPDWITKQTMLSHMLAEDVTFDFSKMVQWAYDQNFTDEPRIAYNYALFAEEDANAVAASLAKSKYADEVWTLQDLSLENLHCAPTNCFKKGAQQVEVVYDGEESNSMLYTRWEHIYVQDDDETWYRRTGKVDRKGIYYDWAGEKVYYVDFEPDMLKYSSRQMYVVRTSDGELSSFVPVSSSTPRSRGQTEGDSGPIPKRRRLHSPDPGGQEEQRQRQQQGQEQRQGQGQGQGQEAEVPRPVRRPVCGEPTGGDRSPRRGGGPTGPAPDAPAQRVGGRPDRLAEERIRRSPRPAADQGGRRFRSLQASAVTAPVIVVRGGANSLKCIRYRLHHQHHRHFKTISTTFHWLNAGHTDRAGHAEIIIRFVSEEQRLTFLETGGLPEKVDAILGTMPFFE